MRVDKLSIGDHVQIGHLNIIRGGDEVRLGRYSEIIRMNEINSIPDPDVVNPTDPRFLLGEGSIITASHKIDFTDRVEIGRRSILGGQTRLSGRTTDSEPSQSKLGRSVILGRKFALLREVSFLHGA